MARKLSQLEVLCLYKKNMLLCIDQLINIFPEEGDLVMLRILFEDQIPIEESMKELSSRIIPAKENIKNRNEQFFLNSNIIFSGVDEDKISKWKQVWKSNRLDKDDKETMFKWFELFESLAEMYVANISNENS